MKYILFTLFFVGWSVTLTHAQQEKKRVIVLTDIEADPDDTHSLIRFLLGRTN